MAVFTVLACLAAVSMASAEEARSSTGPPSVLRGTVTLGPQIMARRIRFSHYADVSQAVPAPRETSLDEEMKNVVVFIESPVVSDAAVSRASGTFTMEQKNEEFLPHVLAVPRGSTVQFPNSDPIFHNVFSLSKASSFDLGRYSRGNTRSIRFDKPGIVKVFCHIHSDMSAVILVLDTPFFTAPDNQGSFELRGLPAGEYTVNAWHERARLIRRTVRLEPGREVHVELDIPLQDAPLGE